MKNIPYLDGWRGLAIIFVLIDHFGPHRFWYMGRLGVVLFFVLSGLFMGRLLFIQRVPLPSFFARRFSRIIPALFIYVGVMWIYSSYFQLNKYQAEFAEVASILTFTSTYFLSIWELKWPVGQLWSLNVEEHGYVYLATGALIIAKARRRISASTFLAFTLVAICIIICLYLTEVLVVSGSPWRTRSEVACLGLVASAAFCVWREDGHLSRFENNLLPLAALAIGLASFVIPGAFAWNFSILAAPIFLAYAINYASSFPEIIKRGLSLKPVRWFGTCSFSIYLWQGPFYAATFIPGTSRTLCLLGGVIAGAMSYYFIEHPARMYLNRLWDKKTVSTGGAGFGKRELA